MRDAMSQPASDAQVAAFAQAKGTGIEDARAALEAMREKQIARRLKSPYAYGYEPPIWFVAKALMRNPMWSGYERETIARRYGGRYTAETFAEAMRKKLGFEHAVTRILIMGSNRSGKTDFASKLCMQTLMAGNRFVCSGAQTLKTQKKNQMARVWKYMPEAWKKKNVATMKAKSAIENISYTEKNGFAGSRVTFGNGSKLDFVSYEQTTNSLEGVEYDLAWLDEEYGIGFYNLYTTRITSRAGMFLGTFTPLNGYTSPIAAFLDSMEVARYHTAYLRPIDGGAKAPWAELGLSEDEYARLTAWRKAGQEGDCGVCESRPEDCFAWLEEAGERRPEGPARQDAWEGGQRLAGQARQDGEDGGQRLAGQARQDRRVFDRVPRVGRCLGGEAAAVWFYGSDNPYGLPSELILAKMADENAEAKIYASVYGMAKKLKGRLFTTFEKTRNVVKASEVPVEGCVDFMVMDPAAERNWCFGWYRYHVASGVLYKYREWPGMYEVPGIGVPGAWAVASDKRNGINDGARGEAQESFGWGYRQYSEEVARLEGDEEMAFRLVDSRAAAATRTSAQRSLSLFEELEELFDGLMVADGQKTEVGYSRMLDKLAAGTYRISEECENTLACYALMTGADGQKGAAKDMIDCDRYAIMSDIWAWEATGVKSLPRQDGEEVGKRPGSETARGRRRRKIWY